MSSRAAFGVRVAAALAIWAAGAVHLWLYTHDDYSGIHLIGTLFLVNGIAAALIGIALCISGIFPIILSGIGYALATLLAFVVSASQGLFGWKEAWFGPPQAVAGLTEVAALLLLFLVGLSTVTVLRSGSNSSWQPDRGSV